MLRRFTRNDTNKRSPRYAHDDLSGQMATLLRLARHDKLTKLIAFILKHNIEFSSFFSAEGDGAVELLDQVGDQPHPQ